MVRRGPTHAELVGVLGTLTPDELLARAIVVMGLPVSLSDDADAWVESNRRNECTG